MNSTGTVILGLLPHPPYSPDLAPSDYPLFGPMKKILGGQKFASHTEMQSTVCQWLKTAASIIFLHQAFRNFLTNGINEFGRYIENETLMSDV